MEIIDWINLDTNVYAHQFLKTGDIADFRKKLNSMYIYIQETQLKTFRLHSKGFSNQIEYNSELDLPKAECNGLLFQVVNEKAVPVSIPPFCYKTMVNRDLINANIHLYDVIPIIDGTTIHLYYDINLGTWIINTFNGTDMKDVKWNGLTYGEYLECVLQKYKLTLTSFYESLDSNYNYAFILKHPNFHFFLENKDRYDTSTDLYNLLFIHRVKLSNPSIREYASDTTIKSQTIVNLTLKSIFGSCAHALDSWLTKREVNYGYMLRLKSEIGISQDAPVLKTLPPSIMLESSLHKYIKNALYNFTLNKMIETQLYHNKDLVNGRKWFIIIYNFILQQNINITVDQDPNKKNKGKPVRSSINNWILFTKMFPQFTIEYANIQTIMDLLVNAIFSKTTKVDIEIPTAALSLTNIEIQIRPQIDAFDTQLKRVSQIIMRELCKIFTLDSLSEKESKTIIYQFIKKMDYIHDIYELFSLYNYANPISSKPNS